MEYSQQQELHLLASAANNLLANAARAGSTVERDVGRTVSKILNRMDYLLAEQEEKVTVSASEVLNDLLTRPKHDPYSGRDPV